MNFSESPLKIFYKSASYQNFSEKTLNKVFQQVLKNLSLEKKILKKIITKKKLIINLILTNNTEIKKLNQKWRKKNQATDVLSFPYFDFKNLKFLEELKQIPEANFVFGEIFISVPYIKKQAQENNISLKEEMFKIFIHGILHIFGYNHLKDQDFLEMKTLEDKIFNSLVGEK